ncbi:uncharacterized protein LOC113336409 isoform X1 [Papaver somniferum]|uniref:uncharacterized protein LOC113336409 isoform X1 n=1 Tax=Papaver somniferum TaxID=3469 RepID=UPI000E701FEF|nr:uncharacterized protein LOC113336409 isoform X1 [Papaver somniferum]
MSTPESCSESGEEADYENSYDCNTDSDSECLALIEKFDFLFGDNCFVKIEDSEGQPAVDDNVKSQAASSSATSLADSHTSETQDVANKNIDDEATCRKKLDPYGEIWKKRALYLIMDVRGNVGNYNKARAFFFLLMWLVTMGMPKTLGLEFSSVTDKVSLLLLVPIMKPIMRRGFHHSFKNYGQ